MPTDPKPRKQPRPPSKGKLRAEALEQARRERKQRRRGDGLRLLGLRGGWIDPSSGGAAPTSAGGSAGGSPGAPSVPAPRPGQYSDMPGGGASFDDASFDGEGPGPETAARRGWHRLRGFRVTGLLLLGLILVVVLAIHGRSSTAGPALARNCATPALAVAPVTVAKNAVVRYTVAGPSSGQYAVAVDATAVRRASNGKYTAVSPVPGRKVEAVAMSTIGGCRKSGAFPIVLDPGTHQVNLLRVTPTGTSLVASRAVTVTP